MPFIPEKTGVAALREVVGHLEVLGVRYWLGRGVLRHHTLHGEFGDRQGDIDFHVLDEDRDGLVRKAVTAMERAGWQRISLPSAMHKITLERAGVEVEFVYLYRDGDVLWHLAGWPEKKRFDCLAKAFRDRRETICGIVIRVPEEDYLEAVFGPDWHAEEKGSGGVGM